VPCLVQRDWLEASARVGSRNAERLRSHLSGPPPGRKGTPPHIRGSERALRARAEDEPFGPTSAHPVPDKVLSQDARYWDGSTTGARLGPYKRTRLEVVASVDPHDSLDEIDVLPPEGSKLTGPETCEECGRPQRLVFRSERCEQLGRLARRDDSVSESFDSRKLKATRRVDRDLTPADRTAVDDANRRDRVADCGRIEPGCPQAVDELLDVEVAYLREESPSELGQDAVAQRLLVPAHDRCLVRLPVALRDLPFTRTGDPFARGFTKSSPRGWCQRSRPEGD
jgi:hypothetical protein